VLCAIPISASLISSFKIHLRKSKRYEDLHYAVFSNILLFHPSRVQIYASASSSQITSIYFLPLISETKIIISSITIIIIIIIIIGFFHFT
jgi:hypothetical protein